MGLLGISLMLKISNPEITVRMRCPISLILSGLGTLTDISRGRLSRANRPQMKNLKIIKGLIRIKQ